MITKNEVYDHIYDAIIAFDENAYITGETNRTPPEFPAVWIVDIGWTPERKYTAIDLSDEQVRSTYEVQTFSAKMEGAFLEARDLLDVATAAFREIGYRCTYFSPVDNYADSSISRYVGRYERMIGGGDTLPEDEQPDESPDEDDDDSEDQP